MTPEEAEKIVNQFGGVISVPGVAPFIRKKSSLPYSSGRIKMAYFVLIDALIKRDGPLPQKIGEMLSQTYIQLGQFIDDEEADKLSKIHLKYKSLKNLNDKLGKDPEAKEEYMVFMKRSTGAIMSADLQDEFADFVNECYRKYCK